MPDSASPPVALDFDSLYVATIPLTSGFHWGLIHVDRNGTATRHHWAATTVDPRGHEGYVAQPMPHGPRTKAGQQPILAYFKLTALGAPVALPALRDACAAVFPRAAHTTALQNRAANVNSRTWVTHVLARLLASPQRAAEVEEFVLAHSRVYGDEYARDFLSAKPYTTVVLPIERCDSDVSDPATRSSDRASCCDPVRSVLHVHPRLAPEQIHPSCARRWWHRRSRARTPFLSELYIFPAWCRGMYISPLQNGPFNAKCAC